MKKKNFFPSTDRHVFYAHIFLLTSTAICFMAMLYVLSFSIGQSNIATAILVALLLISIVFMRTVYREIKDFLISEKHAAQFKK